MSRCSASAAIRRRIIAIFKRQHELNFTLLADPSGSIAKAFGVTQGKGGSIERQIDGRAVTLTRGTTAHRWTFVIGLDGKIAYVDRQVKPTQDAANVLEVIAKLQGKD